MAYHKSRKKHACPVELVIIVLEWPLNKFHSNQKLFLMMLKKKNLIRIIENYSLLIMFLIFDVLFGYSIFLVQKNFQFLKSNKWVKNLLILSDP